MIKKLFLLAICTSSLSACRTTPQSEVKQETDDRTTALTDQLIDVSEIVNAFVNSQIDAARKQTNPDSGPWSPTLKMDLINNIGKRLASVHKGSGIGIHAGTFNLEISTLSEIESQIESRLSESRHEILRISFADSRYGDNPIGLTQALVLSHLTMSTANHSISPVIRIGSEIIGLDKLGHFAEEGYWYFLAETSGLLQGPSERWQFGQFMEGAPDLNEELYPKYKAIYGKFCQTCVLLGGFGFYGSASTGVCSQADMQSNEDGYQFFEELHQNPDSFSFDIRNYDISKWNENISKNIYVEGLKVRP